MQQSRVFSIFVGFGVENERVCVEQALYFVREFLCFTSEIVDNSTDFVHQDGYRQGSYLIFETKQVKMCYPSVVCLQMLVHVLLFRGKAKYGVSIPY